MTFASDFNWQMGFVPSIKRIVGPLILDVAPLELDQSEATDLVILRGRDMRIGCRMRRYGYAERFPWDFTIRSHRDTGAVTELEKITNGFGDLLFYGHQAEQGSAEISRWFAIDLDVWRSYWPKVKGVRQSNGDGTYFHAFDVRTYPDNPAIYIASSHPIPRQQQQLQQCEARCRCGASGQIKIGGTLFEGGQWYCAEHRP